MMTVFRDGHSRGSGEEERNSPFAAFSSRASSARESMPAMTAAELFGTRATVLNAPPYPFGAQHRQDTTNAAQLFGNPAAVLSPPPFQFGAQHRQHTTLCNSQGRACNDDEDDHSDSDDEMMPPLSMQDGNPMIDEEGDSDSDSETDDDSDSYYRGSDSDDDSDVEENEQEEQQRVHNATCFCFDCNYSREIRNRRRVRAIRPQASAQGRMTTRQVFSFGSLEDNSNNNNSNRNSNSNDDDSTVVEDPDAPCCAICLEPASTKHNRRLIELPCCGTNGREQTSSTRFCQECFKKYLQQQNAKVVYHSSWQNHSIGECPRCKHLLVLRLPETAITGTPSEATPSNPELACSLQMFWYAERKSYSENMGAYRSLLILMAGFHFDYMPIQAFKPSTVEMVEHLARWGVLQRRRKNGDNDHIVFSMSPAEQTLLRMWCAQFLKIERGGSITTRLASDNTRQADNNWLDHCKLHLYTACHLIQGSVVAAGGFNMVRSVRLASRAVILLLVAARLLPPLTEWRVNSNNAAPPRWIGWLETCLIGFLFFLLIKTLVQLFWIAIYAALAFAVSRMVGAWIKPLPSGPNQQTLRIYVVMTMVVMPVVVLTKGWCLYKNWFMLPSSSEQTEAA